jgi:hypothetical protein
LNTKTGIEYSAIIETPAYGNGMAAAMREFAPLFFPQIVAAAL